jgi:hypothetical protein
MIIYFIVSETESILNTFIFCRCKGTWITCVFTSDLFLYDKAKIKILFVSPFPTDPIKSARPGNYFIPEIFSVPFRKREKTIWSISIRYASRITYDFIESHWDKSKTNNILILALSYKKWFSIQSECFNISVISWQKTTDLSQVTDKLYNNVVSYTSPWTGFIVESGVKHQKSNQFITFL